MSKQYENFQTEIFQNKPITKWNFGANYLRFHKPPCMIKNKSKDNITSNSNAVNPQESPEKKERKEQSFLSTYQDKDIIIKKLKLRIKELEAENKKIREDLETEKRLKIENNWISSTLKLRVSHSLKKLNWESQSVKMFKLKIDSNKQGWMSGTKLKQRNLSMSNIKKLNSIETNSSTWLTLNDRKSPGFNRVKTENSPGKCSTNPNCSVSSNVTIGGKKSTPIPKIPKKIKIVAEEEKGKSSKEVNKFKYKEELEKIAEKANQLICKWVDTINMDINNEAERSFLSTSSLFKELKNMPSPIHKTK